MCPLKGGGSPGRTELSGAGGIFGMQADGKYSVRPGYALSGYSGRKFSGVQESADVPSPDSVQVISARAFYKCVSLNALKLPRRIRVIGREAFYQTGMNELELPKGLEVIEDSAFLKCSQLTYVRLPRSVKRIEKWAFHGCNRLKTLEIAHDPEFIGEWIINRSAAIRCVRGGKVDRYCQNAGFTTEYI